MNRPWKKSFHYSPLAERMRPRTLEEFEEQTEIVGKGTPLRRSIEADNLMSVIFYGPREPENDFGQDNCRYDQSSF